MGGGRETGNHSNKEDKIIVYPSEIHSFAYCPRKYFFNLYMPVERSFRERLRLLAGTIFHALMRVRDRLRGYRSEERITLDLGSVLLVGRPDSYKSDESGVTIIERKSGSGPRSGAWISDALQAAAYGLMLRGDNGEVKLLVEYRGRRRGSVLDEDKLGLLFRIIDDIVLVKKYGIVPYPKRSPARCAKCPFRDVCNELDEKLDCRDEVYEPGSYLEGVNVDNSFK